MDGEAMSGGISKGMNHKGIFDRLHHWITCPRSLSRTPSTRSPTKLNPALIPLAVHSMSRLHILLFETAEFGTRRDTKGGSEGLVTASATAQEQFHRHMQVRGGSLPPR